MDGTSEAFVAPPLPDGLPQPVDDGRAVRLAGTALPRLVLPSTDGVPVDLAELGPNGLVLYAFPKMAPPNVPDPPGWAETPGAYGCTQESCAFRDRDARFRALGYSVAGISAQTEAEQRDTVRRLQLSFPLLADPELSLAHELDLPTFEIGGTTLYRRLTLVARDGRIQKAFYPVFPPDRHPDEVLEWLQADAEGARST